MRKKTKKSLKTLPAKKVSGRKAAKVRGGGMVDMALSLANKQQGGGTKGGTVQGNWNLAQNPRSA